VDVTKLRQGSFFPSILERRRRVDRALCAVVMEAYVQGVSTAKSTISQQPSEARGSRRARSPASSHRSMRRWQGFAPAGVTISEFP